MLKGAPAQATIDAAIDVADVPFVLPGRDPSTMRYVIIYLETYGNVLRVDGYFLDTWSTWRRAAMFPGRVFFLVSLGGQAPHVLRATWGCDASHVRGAKRNRSDRRSRGC